MNKPLYQGTKRPRNLRNGSALHDCTSIQNPVEARSSADLLRGGMHCNDIVFPSYSTEG